MAFAWGAASFVASVQIMTAELRGHDKGPLVVRVADKCGVDCVRAWEIEVTVKKKCTSYVKGAYIEEYTYFLNDRVRGIQKEDWETLKPGNKVRLFGKKSYFGFSYRRYEIIR